MPTRKVRQWRQTILHRRRLIGRIVQLKSRIRGLLKSQGLRKPRHRGNWRKAANRLWMTGLSKMAWSSGQLWRMDESGNCKRLGHINKQGPSVVRRLAGESAWRVIKQSPAIKAFYERVLARQDGRKKIAVVTIARNLLSIMRAIL
jgi:transposase